MTTKDSDFAEELKDKICKQMMSNKRFKIFF